MENKPANSDSPPWEEVQEIYSSPTILSELEQQEARKIVAYSDTLKVTINVFNIISAVLLVLGTVFLFASFPHTYKSTAYRLGYTGGGLIAFGGISLLLSWLIQRLLLRGKKHLRVLCFTLIFFLLSCWRLGGLLISTPETFGNDSASAYAEGRSEWPPKNAAPYSAPFIANNFIDKYNIELQHTLIDLWQEIRDQQIGAMLTPEVLDNKTAIKEYQEGLKRILGILTEYEANIKHQAVESNKAAQSLQFANESDRQSFLSQFSSIEMRNDQYSADYMRAEKALVQDMYSLLTFLEQKHGKYKLRDGKFIFKSSKDADSFNKLAAAIKELLAEETATEQLIQRDILGNGVQAGKY